MRLKTFYAASMTEAMQQIRAALGADAVIIASRRRRDGSVEVSAAIEPDRPAAATPAAATPAAGLQAAASTPAPRSNAALELAQVLAYHAMPPRLTERLSLAAATLGPATPEAALRAVLDDAFGFRPLPVTPGRPLILLGLPGAGKTVAVAKLAARAVLAGGAVTLITCDTVKAGGISQLAAFTELMRQPLLAVDQPAELARQVTQAAARGPVLIDTPGTNPFDESELSALKRLVAAAGAEPVLVMAAGGEAAEAAEAASAFAGAGASRLLATRLDTARRYGGLLNAAAVSGLRFCDVSITPSVAKGVHPLDAAILARLLLRDPHRAPISSEFEEAAE